MTKKVLPFFLVLILITLLSLKPINKNLFVTQFQAGDVSNNSVIIQARLVRDTILTNLNIKGEDGYLKFEIYENTFGLTPIKNSEWIKVDSSTDYIGKYYITNLKSATKYYYKVNYSKNKNTIEGSKIQTFYTNGKKDVSFVMVACNHFYRFYKGGNGGGINSKNFPPATGIDSILGYPSLQQIYKLQPDYYVSNGDNVYYDHWFSGAAKNKTQMRQHWHCFYSLPRVNLILSQMGMYFMKDDHDFRFDDADTTNISKNKQTIKLPTNEEGKKIFLEQTAVSQPTYRTFLLNEQVQIWMLEGRDYRSPNYINDDSLKSVWGKTQYNWLKKTLLSSNAAFKIIISPTPLLGPDDTTKADNHCKKGGFQYERNLFFKWIDSANLIDKGVIILNGDRHWQYVSVFPNGIEEYSCGALNDQNSRLGPKPGPGSSDPEGKINQLYLQNEPSGGFLFIKNNSEKRSLTLTFYNDEGKILFQRIKNTK